MSGRADALTRLLGSGGLSVHFQPVREIASPCRVHYVEGLVTGPRGTTLERPDVLIDYARRRGEEVALDRACARAVLQAARGLPGAPAIAINVHAATLAADLEFAAFLLDTAEENWIAPERLVVEILEDVAPRGGALAETLSALRSVGVPLCLDDVGCGRSNYKMMLECRPAYFKFGSYLVQGAAQDYYRQAVMRSIVELASRFGARAVAQGVESQADLLAARSAGVTLAQGPWLDACGGSGACASHGLAVVA